MGVKTRCSACGLTWITGTTQTMCIQCGSSSIGVIEQWDDATISVEPDGKDITEKLYDALSDLYTNRNKQTLLRARWAMRLYAGPKVVER